MTATVSGIDRSTRKLTLVSPEGKTQTFKAGGDVVNFDQIQLGDALRVSVTQELVVQMARASEGLADGQVEPVALSARGTKPGALMAETVQLKAVVVGIDQKQRKATLRFPDGSTRTVTVRKDVDLSRRKVGEEVVMRQAESLVIAVEKP